jgi:hypothetical protein
MGVARAAGSLQIAFTKERTKQPRNLSFAAKNVCSATYDRPIRYSKYHRIRRPVASRIARIWIPPQKLPNF